MALGLKYFILLCMLVLMYSVGLLIFAKGFLLKRIVIEKNSTCHADFAMQTDLHGDEGCWMHKRFKKAIIIVIDALRFDFLEYDPTVSSDHPYKNKLTVVDNLLRGKPTHSKLYKFMADPPTTTLQRLKGLTTGSLPTFVDAGSNFHSSEITEDNFIDQLVNRGKKITFLGDDTWLSLFPNRFKKAFPFPSFNVKDLHTVDNGILEHLIPQLKKNDWDVTIAHFLGVDHCGHRYGPNHVAMAEKLTQMNNVIRNVTQLMSDDTVLFVMGDHGMTRTGDHGGDSKDELEAGLFIYSPQQLTASNNIWKNISTVSQTDFVPTISLLLGLPIPFSSLGKIIEELFTYCPWWKNEANEIKQNYHSVKALRLNAQQIRQFVTAYSHTSSDFPINKYYELEHLIQHSESDLQKLVTAMVKDGDMKNVAHRLGILRDHYISYITQVHDICKSIWAKFDYMSMAIGLLTIILTLLINIYCIKIARWYKNEVPDSVIVLVIVCLLYLAFAVFQSFFVGDNLSSLMVYILAGVLIVAMVIAVVKFKTKEPIYLSDLTRKEKQLASNNDMFHIFVSSAVMFLYFISFFSNSYVIHEDSVTVFFAQTISWIFCVDIVRQNLAKYDTSQTETKNKRHAKSQQQPFDIMRFFTHPVMATIFTTLVFNICIRFSANFRACREEQSSCMISIFHIPLSNLSEDLQGYKSSRYFFSAGCLISIVYLSRKLMQKFGNLNGSDPYVMCVKYVFPTATASCLLYWALQALPQKILDSLPIWQQVILARIVYVLVSISFLTLIIKPLQIYVIPQPKNDITPRNLTSDKDDIIPQVFNKVKEDMNNQQIQDRPPIVCGLATACSSPVIYLVTTVILLLGLLLGDGLSPSLLLVTLTVFIYMEIIAARRLLTKYITDDSTTSLWPIAVFYSILCSVFFFATGHQATVPSIRWESAFTGFVGDFNNHVVPAILILMNTFASHVLFGVISPLVVMWPFTEGVIARALTGKKKEEGWKGDFVLVENEEFYRKLLFQLISSIFMFHGIKVFGSVCAAAVHRRHLMAWKIFAPRFVFEAVSCFTVFAISLLMYLFVLWVDKSLHKWIATVEKRKSR